MKNLFFLFILIPSFFLGNNTQPTPSKIKKVTVFVEGASVVRNASLNLVAGENKIILNNLSPVIDESSIQISGLQNVSISALTFEINYLEKKQVSIEYESFVTQIKTLQRQQNEIKNEVEGYQEEVKLLQNNQKINSDATDLSLENVKQMSTYYRTRVTEIKNEIFERNIAMGVITKNISDIRKELNKLEDSKKEERGSIRLKLDAPAPTNLVLNISYTVSNAGWFPLYDIRAVDTASPIAFTYKAHVFQQTGMDWDNVNIILSTGDPTTNNNKPSLDSKYLNFVSRNYNPTAAIGSTNVKYNPTIQSVSGIVYDDSGLPLPGANVIIKGTSIGTQTDFDGNYSLNVAGGRELAYSYVGFDTKTMPINASTMNAQLEANASLQEVVVTGYGTSSGSQFSYKKKEYNVAQVLQGNAAGVQITNANGSVGASSNIRIRGVSSIPSQNPLYVVDGQIMSKGAVKQIDGDMIKEIQVLKGNAAAKLYGSKSRNGVIVITTKELTSSGAVKETSITNTRFEINKKYTIPSNKDVTVIEVDSFNFTATYQHYSAPALNENVFLTATIKDWEKYNLLFGEANIYFDGSFAGKTILNPFAIAQALELSLGIDPNVVVKRKSLDNFKSKSFLGTNRIVNKGYVIEVKNTKQTAVTLLIEDRIPISQNKEIKLDDVNTNDANYNEETGILQWELTLTPTETIEKEFSYTVKFPKYKKISL